MKTITKTNGSITVTYISGAEWAIHARRIAYAQKYYPTLTTEQLQDDYKPKTILEQLEHNAMMDALGRSYFFARIESLVIDGTTYTQDQLLVSGMTDISPLILPAIEELMA